MMSGHLFWPIRIDCAVQRAVSLVRFARKELQTALRYVDAGHRIVTQTAAKVSFS